ncbi:hypothetical protein [uncultured Piscinibacter sp.]|uniref:hypothetical protein n=1 Tax=uncultured Piscinibacter sp. TaxID=1131835 RepID=UPI0026226B81|nr:hypothetical protein [uncultured Piscinibacter sp.]
MSDMAVHEPAPCTERSARARPGPAPAWAPTRLGTAVAGLLLLAAFGSGLGGWLAEFTASPAWTMSGSPGRLVWIGMLVVYVIAMALPFVPGIEIGLALMLAMGVDGIVLVYAGTQLALAASFLCGRFLPRAQLTRLIETLRPGGAKTLLDGADALPPPERIARLAAHPAAPWLRRVLRRRGVALVLLLNLPGNALLGGAGGIALLAGSSRLFGLARFLVLSALATSPLPLMLLWLGRA